MSVADVLGKNCTLVAGHESGALNLESENRTDRIFPVKKYEFFLNYQWNQNLNRRKRLLLQGISGCLGISTRTSRVLIFELSFLTSVSDMVYL